MHQPLALQIKQVVRILKLRIQWKSRSCGSLKCGNELRWLSFWRIWNKKKLKRSRRWLAIGRWKRRSENKCLVSQCRKWPLWRAKFVKKPQICRDVKSALSNLKKNSKVRSWKSVDSSPAKKKRLWISRKSSRKRESSLRVKRKSWLKRSVITRAKWMKLVIVTSTWKKKSRIVL